MITRPLRAKRVDLMTEASGIIGLLASEYLIEVLTLAAILGGFGKTLYSLNKRFDKLENRDERHDEQLTSHEVRIVKIETTVGHHKEIIERMSDKLDQIYERVVKGN